MLARRPQQPETRDPRHLPSHTPPHRKVASSRTPGYRLRRKQEREREGRVTLYSMLGQRERLLSGWVGEEGVERLSGSGQTRRLTGERIADGGDGWWRGQPPRGRQVARVASVRTGEEARQSIEQTRRMKPGVAGQAQWSCVSRRHGPVENRKFVVQISGEE